MLKASAVIQVVLLLVVHLQWSMKAVLVKLPVVTLLDNLTAANCVWKPAYRNDALLLKRTQSFRTMTRMLTLVVQGGVHAATIVLTVMIATDVAQMQPVEWKTTYDNVTVTRDTLVMEQIAHRSVVRMKYGERVLVRNLVLTLLPVYPALVKNVIVRTDFIYKKEIVFDKNSVAVILMEIFYRTVTRMLTLAAQGDVHATTIV